jgi:hypothetical protein
VAGTGQFKQDIATARPPTGTSAAVAGGTGAVRTLATALPASTSALVHGGIGSNAIALGCGATRNHTGMLLANDLQT